MDELIEHFSTLEDPRCPGKVAHPLLDILVVTVCAVIAGADGWEDVALYGRSKLGWLRQFLPLPHGIPSHDTFRRVFMLIDPDAFEACFLAWVNSLAEPVEREVIAIDGKTLRRSFNRARDQSPLHLVSAWASEQSLVLAQHAVKSKSNEITAIPALLDTLALENTLVTLDAMGAQKSIAAQIQDRGADYLLILKPNQGKAYGAVREHFDEHCFRRGASGRAEFQPPHTTTQTGRRERFVMAAVTIAPRMRPCARVASGKVSCVVRISTGGHASGRAVPGIGPHPAKSPIASSAPAALCPSFAIARRCIPGARPRACVAPGMFEAMVHDLRVILRLKEKRAPSPARHPSSAGPITAGLRTPPCL